MDEKNGADVTESEAQASGPSRSISKERSAGFPAMSLPDAVQAVRTIAAYGFTHTPGAVADRLGHSTANSGPFRTKLASLKDYGLMAGRGDTLTVTPLGQDLTHPSPDSDIPSLMVQAFRACTIFAQLIDSLRPGQEVDVSGIANMAVRNLSVAPGSKAAFAKSFVDGASAAGLLVVLDGGKVRLAPASGESAPQEEADADENRGARTPRQRPRHGDSVPVVHHVWPVQRGEIVLEVTYDGPLPAKAYGLIQTIIEHGDTLASLLGPENTTADDAPQ